MPFQNRPLFLFFIIKIGHCVVFYYYYYYFSFFSRICIVLKVCVTSQNNAITSENIFIF